jgi:hypothetical protein
MTEEKRGRCLVSGRGLIDIICGVISPRGQGVASRGRDVRYCRPRTVAVL